MYAAVGTHATVLASAGLHGNASYKVIGYPLGYRLFRKGDFLGLRRVENETELYMKPIILTKITI